MTSLCHSVRKPILSQHLPLEAFLRIKKKKTTKEPAARIAVVKFVPILPLLNEHKTLPE